jgi:RHS repeat-associated protein
LAKVPRPRRLLARGRGGSTGSSSPQKRGSTVSYYLADAQSSTRLLTSSAAAVTDTYRYSAFGDIETQTGTTTNSYLYTGQQFDTSTGLYSLRVRYYDAAVGRFLSRDTYPVNRQNPMELNRYVYAAGNPVRWGDPSGHSFIEALATRFKVSEQTVVYGIGIAVLSPIAVVSTALLLRNSMPLVLPAIWSGDGNYTEGSADNPPTDLPTGSPPLVVTPIPRQTPPPFPGTGIPVTIAPPGMVTVTPPPPLTFPASPPATINIVYHRDPRAIDWSNNARFNGLATDPQTGTINNKGRIEAQGILQAEHEGILSNSRRPNPASGESTAHNDYYATYVPTGQANTPVDVKTAQGIPYRTIPQIVNDIAGGLTTMDPSIVVIIDLGELNLANATNFRTEWSGNQDAQNVEARLNIHFVNRP